MRTCCLPGAGSPAVRGEGLPGVPGRDSQHAQPKACSFDHKGIPKPGRHTGVEGSSGEEAPSMSPLRVQAICIMLVLHAQVLRPRKGHPESIRALC